MKYYEKYFSLKDIERKFDEYCKKFEINDFGTVDRFIVTREFQGDFFLEASKNGVMNKLRNFIEFHHPIIFKIKDKERECDIIEIFLGDTVWSYNCLDWKK